ncbi:MAG TPA: chromosome segregation protein, partial [Planctomycetaceae bacterium]|nr:chromosome segregation protein [Planctomycetaceae bacterium]
MPARLPKQTLSCSSCATTPNLRILLFAFFVLACLPTLLASETQQSASQDVAATRATVRFNQDVRPILADRCFHCHGPDEAGRRADLRLDKPNDSDAVGWDSVVSDNWDESELWLRIVSDNPDEQMPPPESHKERLTPAERQVVAEWLQAGAPFEQFWSFAPVQAYSPPSLNSPELSRWANSPIDRFVASQFAESGISPTEQASRRTIVRRLSLDLTGIPPTMQEIDAFVGDQSPTAYRDLVDRLLSSKRYGEHMAKYWLDLVRFADTNGIHHDHFRELTPYRDWVIRSFNDNLPFDEFAVAQIAGDLLPEPTQDQLIGSGFNRLHLVIDRGTALPEESHTRNVVDRVTAVGTAFMGLTVGCAVCHDHKYDPISQRDFYQLYAFFNNIDAAPETPGRGIHEPALRLPTSEQTAAIKEFDSKLAQLRSLIKAEKARLAAEQSDNQVVVTAGEKGETEDKENPESAANVKSEVLKEYEAKLKSLTAQKRNVEKGVLTTLIMKERP